VNLFTHRFAMLNGAWQSHTPYIGMAQNALIERGRGSWQPEMFAPRPLRLACKPCAGKIGGGAMAGWGVSGCFGVRDKAAW